MPNQQGVPTLADLIGQADKWGGELLAQKAKSQQNLVKQQQAHIVDPKTGKTVAGVFNPTDGSYKTTEHELGYGPRTDPETGFVIPSAQAQQRGQQGLQNMLSPPQSNNPSQAPQQPTINPKQREGLEKGLTRLKSDPTYKEQSDMVMKMDELIEKTKLAQSNPVASAQLGAEVAKLYEGGRLTDEDVVRYTRDPSAGGRIRDGIYKLSKGTHSPETMNALRIALAAKRAQAQHNVGDLGNAESERVNTMYNLPTSVGSKVTAPPSRAQRLQPNHSKESQSVQPQVQSGAEQPEEGMFGGIKNTLRNMLSPKKETPAPAPKSDKPMTFEEFKAKRKAGHL